MDHQNLSAPACAQISDGRRLIAAGYVRRAPDTHPEPSDLDVAISVAQQLLDSDQVLSLREALRLLLRALGAQNGELHAAIRTAQKMLAAYGDSSGFGEFGYAQAHGAITESLRIVLRALGAEDGAA